MAKIMFFAIVLQSYNAFALYDCKAEWSIYFFAFVWLCFLNIADILPCFYFFGSSHTASELLKSLASGLHKWLDNFFNNIGWTPPGPTDLHILRLTSNIYPFTQQ